MCRSVKSKKFAKLLFVICFAGGLLCSILEFYTLYRAYTNLNSVSIIPINFEHYTANLNKVIVEGGPNDLLYILFWTEHNNTETDIVDGQDIFNDYLCPYSNCYVTTNKYLLNKDYTKFDAIVFNVSSIFNWKKDLPENRSRNQKFVFHSVQSSDEHPVCNILTDNYFNLTWTYKLDSDIVAKFLEVRDMLGNFVAPKQIVQWVTPGQNITNNEEIKFKRKRKAMVWIVDKCDARNGRLDFAKNLQSLFRKNLLDFDIFGCDFYDCSDGLCHKAIKDYYFYFVAEDSIAVDYVTADVLKAYNNYAVPVVYGGADYRKFLPEGSYINIKVTSMDGFVALIQYIIKNPSRYYEFHSWRNTYTIHGTKRLPGICELCGVLNNWHGTKIKTNFRKWWFDKPLYNRCLPGGAESFSELLSYVNSSRHRL